MLFRPSTDWMKPTHVLGNTMQQYKEWDGSICVDMEIVLRYIIKHESRVHNSVIAESNVWCLKNSHVLNCT